MGRDESIALRLGLFFLSEGIGKLSDEGEGRDDSRRDDDYIKPLGCGNNSKGKRKGYLCGYGGEGYSDKLVSPRGEGLPLFKVLQTVSWAEFSAFNEKCFV